MAETLKDELDRSKFFYQKLDGVVSRFEGLSKSIDRVIGNYEETEAILEKLQIAEENQSKFFSKAEKDLREIEKVSNRNFDLECIEEGECLGMLEGFFKRAKTYNISIQSYLKLAIAKKAESTSNPEVEFDRTLNQLKYNFESVTNSLKRLLAERKQDLERLQTKYEAARLRSGFNQNQSSSIDDTGRSCGPYGCAIQPDVPIIRSPYGESGIPRNLPRTNNDCRINGCVTPNVGVSPGVYSRPPLDPPSGIRPGVGVSPGPRLGIRPMVFSRGN